MRIFFCSFVLFTLLAPSATMAASPVLTDDARVVDPQSCQLKSLAKRNRNSTEYLVLSGCSPVENLELMLVGTITREDRASQNTDLMIQAKRLFKPLKTNSYGYGLVVGYAQHPRLDNNSSIVGNAYAYVPVSASFFSDKLILHANLGALHDKEKSRTDMIFGFGSEIPLASKLYLIAETYGEHRSRPYYQAGLRYWLVQDRVQIDITYGNRIQNNSDERWLSIGLRLLSAPLW